MKKAIRDYYKDFIAVLILLAIGLTTLFVILSQQATALPAWFPILGADRFALKAEVQTAQAVTPGQGQTVNIAGVKVGDITTVELQDGVAVISMEVEPEYAELIHPDASILMRPRTGLQDMTVELDPGTETETVDEGFTVPLAATKPNVNLDQIISSLDADTQAYLKLLLAGGSEALGGEKSKELAAVLRRIEPTARDLAKINGQLSKRRSNLRRVITNFGLIAQRLSRNDVRVAEFVDSQNAVLGAFADQEQSIRATLRGLPGALTETRRALSAGEALSVDLEPALRELLPAARALDPALESLQPFFRKTIGPVRNQIRPFTKKTLPFVKNVRSASEPLAQSAAGLEGSFSELSQLVNGLAYNPPGKDEGYLFYLSWLGHNANSLQLVQDSGGPMLRGIAMYACATSTLADNALVGRPAVDVARTLTRLATTTEIC